MKYKNVEKYGLTATGKRELLKYLEGGQLTRKQAMLRMLQWIRRWTVRLPCNQLPALRFYALQS